MIKILIADDTKLLCELLESYFQANSNIEVIGSAQNISTLKELLNSTSSDLLLLDYSLPLGGGMAAITWIKTNYPALPILVFSTYNDTETASCALTAGAAGFIAKDSDLTILSDSIQAILQGERNLCRGVQAEPGSALLRLSPREQEVLKLLVCGYTTRLIAETLYISEKTVEAHRAHIKNKIGISSISGLTKFALREGIIDSSF